MTAPLPAPIIGIDTQNITGLGSPQILFVQNPHGGFDMSYDQSPILISPLYPALLMGSRYVAGYTPLRNNPLIPGVRRA